MIDLENFLIHNGLPDLGFCNYCEFSDSSVTTRRAVKTGVLGTGPDVGLTNYSCFSFVAGLIFKRTTFTKFNSNKYDKSIYAQIALAFNMICNGAVLFSIDEPWVRKDITISSQSGNKKGN